MNIGKFQVLYWPRKRLFFLYPDDAETAALGLYRYVYRWIAYLWPVEVRLFR